MAITCIVVTPEATALETKADFVALPLYDGELGVGAGHSPMIGRLGAGELRIKNGGQVSRYFVDGGFVQVADDVVTLLTGRALPAAKLDPAKAQEQLAEVANREAHGEAELEAREKDFARARALLRVATRA